MDESKLTWGCRCVGLCVRGCGLREDRRVDQHHLRIRSHRFNVRFFIPHPPPFHTFVSVLTHLPPTLNFSASQPNAKPSSSPPTSFATQLATSTTTKSARVPSSDSNRSVVRVRAGQTIRRGVSLFSIGSLVRGVLRRISCRWRTLGILRTWSKVEFGYGPG